MNIPDSMGRTRCAYGLGFSLFAKNADQFRPPPVSAHEVILFFSKKEAESGFNRAKCNHRPFYFHRSKDNLYSLDIGGRKSSYRLLFSLDEDVDDLFSAAKAIKVIIIERVDKHD